MLLRWLLFETNAGETLLAFLEKRAGLAVVRAEWLGPQLSGMPQVASSEWRSGPAAANDLPDTSRRARGPGAWLTRAAASGPC